MENFIEYLKYSELIIWIIFIVLVILQQKSSWLSVSLWWGWGGWTWPTFEKRWTEKYLHNLTVILAVLFTVISVVYFLFA